VTVSPLARESVVRHVVEIGTAPAPSFGLSDELPALSGDWHAHRRHQLLFASAGALELHTKAGRWWLPPARAAWIRGGTEHRVVVRHSASLRTVYIDPALVLTPPPDCAVFGVGELARLMLLEATRWGPTHNHQDDVPMRFFAALAALSSEWMDHPLDLRLPQARSPELQRAMQLTYDRLTEPDLTAPTIARAAGMSVRTMSRRFSSECGLSWRELVQRARLFHAMDLLADPERSVTEVCLASGYRSLGTFSATFSERVGVSPRVYRARLVKG